MLGFQCSFMRVFSLELYEETKWPDFACREWATKQSPWWTWKRPEQSRPSYILSTACTTPSTSKSYHPFVGCTHPKYSRDRTCGHDLGKQRTQKFPDKGRLSAAVCNSPGCNPRIMLYTFLSLQIGLWSR